MTDTQGQRLQLAIRNSGRSQRRIALSIGVAPQSITNAIRRDSVSPALAQAVGQATAHRWEWILTGQGPPGFNDLNAGTVALAQIERRLPLVSPASVTTWPLRFNVMAHPFLSVDADLGARLDPAAYCLLVDDDSMRDTSPASVQRGDRVVIDPAVTPRPGDLVVAIVPGQPHALLRRYRERGADAAGRRQVDLVPLNPDFATHTVALGAGGTHLCGVMVEHRRQRRAAAD